MKLFGAALACCLAGIGFACQVAAAAVPVTVQCTAVRAIQTYTVGANATDQVYLMVVGQAAGKSIQQRIPPSATLPAAPKQPAVTEKKPATLWKGNLDDGQFVALTVTLMQGTGQDESRNRQYLQKLESGDKQVAEYGKPVLASPDELKKMAEGLLKADQAIVKDIKKIYSREQKTDHFGGQFTLIVWNNKGTLVKRLDPVGLTFGEHYGNDVKIYSKLKNTRNNVLVQNEKGEWEEQQLEPLNDDQTAARVKALETEYLKEGGNQVRHVTDYLVELQVLGGDNKPLKWNVEDDQPGIDNIHEYWNYAD